MKSLLAWLDRTGLDLGLLVFRIALGGTMLVAHGLPKLFGFADYLERFPDPIGLGTPVSLVLAIGAEVFAALLVILGLGTRLAVAPLVVTMLVAAFVVHGADPFAKKELALLYASGYVALFFCGAGRSRVRLSRLDRWS